MVSRGQVRAITWRDIPTLGAIERQVFGPAAWSQQSWWAELAQRPRRDYLILEVDGQLAGYGGLDCNGDVADLMTLAVLPAWQGQGWGADLLQVVLQRAVERGASQVMLEVRADNTPARRLYQAAGFRTVSTRRGYYQPDGADALVMRIRFGSMSSAAAGVLPSATATPGFAAAQSSGGIA